MSKRTLSSLLLVAVSACRCGTGSYSRPDLPNSVVPGWSLASFDVSQPPPELPPGGSPQCWKAIYSGSPPVQTASVQMWICGYASETAAFDAEQRARAHARLLKFQEGSRLILVQYDEKSKRSDLESLIRAIQKTLRL